MEAKVDIRKLQLLNDRIAQVTDALNQVRLSVHGLTHTGASIGQPGWGMPFGGIQPAPFGAMQQPPYALGQPTGFQHTPYYPGVPAAFGQLPWQSGLQPPFAGGYGMAGSPFGQQQWPWQSGLQSPFAGGPGMASIPFGQQQSPWQSGLQSPFAGGPGMAGIPFGQQQFPWQGGQLSPVAGAVGLQHTGAYGQFPYGGLGGGIQGFGGAGLYQRPELLEQRVIEQRASDPNNILQTFPFCQSPVSAVAW